MLINPSPPRSLGLATALLALPGVLALGRPRFRSRAPTVVYFALALAAYAAMTLEVSQPLWDRAPLLRFVQFPWRMLAPAAACAAALVGAGVRGWEEIGWGGAVVAATIVALADFRWLHPNYTPRGHFLRFCRRLEIGGWRNRSPLCGLFPASRRLQADGENRSLCPRAVYCGPLPADTPQAIEALRADTFQEGAHSYSEYLPVWVQQFPQDEALFEALVAGESPGRVEVESAGDGVTLAQLSEDPTDAAFRVTSAREIHTTYKQFYYPGWRAEVDGNAVAVQPAEGTGLIRLRVPAGEHTVRIRFAETPLRAAADVISIVAGIGWLGAFVFGGRSARADVRRTSAAGARAQSRDHFWWFQDHLRWLGICLLGLGLFAVRVAVLDRVANPLRRTAFDGAEVRGAQPLPASFAGGVELYGFDLASRTLASGEAFDVTLFAGVREPADRRFVPAVSLMDENGLMWSRVEAQFPRWLRAPYSADGWPVGMYALWGRRVAVLPGTPPSRCSGARTATPAWISCPSSACSTRPETLSSPTGAIPLAMGMAEVVNGERLSTAGPGSGQDGRVFVGLVRLGR